MELDKNAIAVGDTKEDKKQRKQFIIDFYSQWIAVNTTKQFFNRQWIFEKIKISQRLQHPFQNDLTGYFPVGRFGNNN